MQSRTASDSRLSGVTSACLQVKSSRAGVDKHFRFYPAASERWSHKGKGPVPQHSSCGTRAVSRGHLKAAPQKRGPGPHTQSPHRPSCPLTLCTCHPRGPHCPELPSDAGCVPSTPRGPHCPELPSDAVYLPPPGPVHALLLPLSTCTICSCRQPAQSRLSAWRAAAVEAP